MSEGSTSTGGESAGGFRCPRCDSREVHRSHARSGVERFLRVLLPVKPYRCAACGQRGWRFDPRPVRSRGRNERPSPTAGRTLESRDHRTIATRRRRQVGAILLASVLGLGAGLVVRACGNGGATTAAP